MQITPAPPMPILPNPATDMQAAAHALPQIATQSVAPITPVSVSPSTKLERSRKAHRRDDMDRQGQQRKEEETRGDHVNLSI